MATKGLRLEASSRGSVCQIQIEKTLCASHTAIRSALKCSPAELRKAEAQWIRQYYSLAIPFLFGVWFASCPGFWICERRSENSIVWITHWKYLSGILLNLYLT